jgi:hypothetical protein
MRATVHGIGLLASGLEGWGASREVLAGVRPYQQGAVPDPEAAILPPNERRRSSDCVRWAVQVAQEAIDQSGLDPRDVPTVFASSGGEMGVFDQLCRVLASEDRRVSPTLFHQSVHNTAAGYWGIATAGQQSSTALSCYDDSFAAGWLEAMTMVYSEQRPVLLVAYDMAVPAPLNEARPIAEGFAVAFVLGPPSNGSTMTVRMSLEQANGGESALPHDQALERLRLDNPAARSLPLLRAIAKTDPESVSLALLGTQQLILSVEACQPSTKMN